MVSLKVNHENRGVGYLLLDPKDAVDMIFEKSAQPIWRNGNPDMVFLGKLKNNFNIFN